jgi:hypothetical protein
MSRGCGSFAARFPAQHQRYQRNSSPIEECVHGPSDGGREGNAGRVDQVPDCHQRVRVAGVRSREDWTQAESSSLAQPYCTPAGILSRRPARRQGSDHLNLACDCTMQEACTGGLASTFSHRAGWT